MKKFIMPSIITALLIIFALSFIDIEKVENTEVTASLLYAVNTIPNELKDVSKLTTRDKDIICATSIGLVEKDNKGNIVPSLASEFTIKEDGIEYQFKIRDDVYWSNGEKVTAENVVDFFKELLKEEKDKNIEAFLDVYGAKEFRKGNTSFESGVAINSNGNIVTIRLNKKNELFLEELTKVQYRIRKYLLMWNDIESNYKTIIYSGQYYINNINNGEVELKKNNDSKSVELIKLFADSNEELSMAAFEMGQRDIVVNPPNTQLNRLQSEGRLKTFESDTAKYVLLNSEEESLPLSARKTLYFNINLSMASYEEENSNYLEIAENSYFREDKENFNKLQSRKVMTTQKEDKIPEVITILAKDSNENRALLKYMQSWFSDNTESSVRYNLVTEEEFENLELRKRYDVVIIDKIANSHDKEKFYSDLKNYYTESELSTYKKIVNLGKNNFDELENKLFDDYSILPLLFEKKNIAISKNIKNIEFDWYGNINFKTLK